MSGRRRTGLLVMWAALLAVGCYPGAPDEIAQSDVVITLQSDRYPLPAGRNLTWAMADTVWPVRYSDLDNASDALDSMILAEVENAMIVYGYERILDPSPENLPDVYVTVANMASLTGFWGVNSPHEDYCLWWEFCEECCASGWLPDYPEEYPAGVFVVGTLFIDMYLPGNIDSARGTLPVTWAAVAHGVIEENLTRARENTRSAIRRAFAQSPYLDVN